MSKKKPAAKNWEERELKDWNVTTFHAYLMEKHEERFGVPYFPFGTWMMEKKMLKTCIDKYGQEVVKKFIDECIRTYKPTPQYAGISFGFMFKYKNNVLQKQIAEARRAEEDAKRREAERELWKDEEDLDWI